MTNPYRSNPPCQECRGEGTIFDFDGMGFSEFVTCRKCKGTGQHTGRMKPLSPNMRKALIALYEGIFDRTDIAYSTLLALERRGLATFSRVWGVGWEATKAGRALVASWNGKR